ncbi:hypothetical protein V6N13_142653 [Hibiscus sabdariffa]
MDKVRFISMSKFGLRWFDRKTPPLRLLGWRVILFFEGCYWVFDSGGLDFGCGFGFLSITSKLVLSYRMSSMVRRFSVKDISLWFVDLVKTKKSASNDGGISRGDLLSRLTLFDTDLVKIIEIKLWVAFVAIGMKLVVGMTLVAEYRKRKSTVQRELPGNLKIFMAKIGFQIFRDYVAFIVGFR